MKKSGGGGGVDRAASLVQGIFLENVLAFVRDHLVSKPLLMTVAASAERDGEPGGDGVQEGFLLLCEVSGFHHRRPMPPSDSLAPVSRRHILWSQPLSPKSHSKRDCRCNPKPCSGAADQFVVVEYRYESCFLL